MIDLCFRLAAVVGTIVYAASILKFRQAKPKRRNKNKRKPEPEKEFQPKLKMEDFPHV